MTTRMTDVVNHPSHYGKGRFTCECIEITRHMTFLAGNATKYIWRHGEKNGREDLEKAAVYLRWASQDQQLPWLPGKAAFVQQTVLEHVVGPLSQGEYDPVYDALYWIGVHGDYGAALGVVDTALHGHYEEPAA